MVSFPPVSPPRPYTPPSPHPYAPHAQPISFFSILSPAQYWVSSTNHLAPRYAISSIPPLPRPAMSHNIIIIIATSIIKIIIIKHCICYTEEEGKPDGILRPHRRSTNPNIRGIRSRFFHIMHRKYSEVYLKLWC